MVDEEAPLNPQCDWKCYDTSTLSFSLILAPLVPYTSADINPALCSLRLGPATDQHYLQRRLRHLAGIVGRNLKPLSDGEPRPYHAYFTLSTGQGRPPFYVSETVFNSINPTWREFDLTQLKDELDLGASKLTVKIWGGYFNADVTPSEGAFKLRIQWDIDLYGLEFYRAKLDEPTQSSVGLPSDSILVRLASGYYHAPSQAEASASSAQQVTPIAVRRVERSKVRTTYKKASLVRILTLQRAIQRVRTSTEVITDQTTQCLRSRQEEQDLNTAIEKMRMVVATFKEEERQRKKQCASRRAQIDSERAAQEERQALIRQSHSTLATTRDELREMKDKLRERRQLLWQAKSMETVRQTRIILELSQIFPVQQGPSPERPWSVCRLELPGDGDYSGCDEDAVATALGYVAHFAFMMAKYLDVPFRFPMRPMCSRSTIIDDVSAATTDEDRIFPLFSHGRHKARFENAVTMLNLNIQQLLAHCLITPPADGGPLANLHVLIRHFFHLNHAHTNGQVAPVKAVVAAQPHPPPVSSQA